LRFRDSDTGSVPGLLPPGAESGESHQFN